MGRDPRPVSPASGRPYRPRHPERTVLYQVLEARFEDYRRVHADRFEPTSGPWRAEVEEAVHAFLDCGRLHGGFARIRCPKCGSEHLLAFSCRTRNLCPSCQSKRSALFAEWLVEAVLLDVPHRHVVFTVPKRLRRLIERERALHGLMAKAAWAVLRDALSEAACEPEGRAGAVVSLQTFGSFGANFHPHLHALVTEGVFTPDGCFHPVIWPEAGVLEEAFRRRFLEALEKAGRLRPETRERFLSWTHSGFSALATQRLAAGERARAERLARYATRVVVAGGRIRRLEGGRVRIETPPDPHTRRTWVDMDELEFVHAVCQQVPARGMHMVRYLGAYANRLRRVYREARARRAGEEVPPGEGRGDPMGEAAVDPREESPPEESPPAVPGSAASLRRQAWARLLRKVFEVEPLLCPRCRKEGRTVEMEIVAWISDLGVVDRILGHRRARGMASVFEPPARAPPAA